MECPYVPKPCHTVYGTMVGGMSTRSEAMSNGVQIAIGGRFDNGVEWDREHRKKSRIERENGVQRALTGCCSVGVINGSRESGHKPRSTAAIRQGDQRCHRGVQQEFPGVPDRTMISTISLIGGGGGDGEISAP